MLVLGLFFSLVACGTDASSSEVTDDETSESEAEVVSEESEKILRIGSDVAIPSIDPQIATDGLSFEVTGSTLVGLLSRDADGALTSGVAESYDISEDGLVYTFHLRTDAVWDNGTPVTANDFVFAWQRVCDPATAAEYSYIVGVADVLNAWDIIDGKMDKSELGVKALDDQTLEVTLTAGAPYFLQLMTFNAFFPINEEFYNAQNGEYGMTPENVLANGPFKIVEWTEGYGLKVMKNDSYWAADEIQIDGIEWLVRKDAQTASLDFEAGELDVVKLSSELVEKYLDDEAFTYEPAGYVWYVAPNMSDTGADELKNVNIRKALAMSFDKSYITNSILADGSVVADYIIPSGLASGPDGTDFRDAQDGTFLSHDVATAQEYWAKGLEELGVETIELELLFDDAESVKNIATFMQSEWQTNLEGLTVTLLTQPKKNRLQLMRDYDYDVALTRWGPDYADPQTYLELFIEGGIANIWYASEEYDALTKSIQAGGALSSSDKVQERWDAMLEAERILLEDDTAIFPIYQAGYAMLINPSVDGIVVQAVGYPHEYKGVTID